MSRLTADQERRGGDGDPDGAEEDSVMWVNLAEGSWPVNAAPRGLFCLSGLSCLSRLRTGLSGS
jgi:hypothetical protein